MEFEENACAGRRNLFSGFEMKCRELCARMTNTEMIIKQFSTNVFVDSIRVAKPAGVTSQNLTDWRKETVPKLTRL